MMHVMNWSSMLRAASLARRSWPSSGNSRQQMNALPVEEPSASFLAASRMRLQESLEQTSPHRAWYQRFAFDPAAWLRQVRFSPALAMVIFMVGFGGGLGAMYQSTRHNTTVTPTPDYTGAAIGGITSIEKDPTNNTVKVQYDRVMPGSVQGSVNDPKVKDLLLYAAKDRRERGRATELGGCAGGQDGRSAGARDTDLCAAV